MQASPHDRASWLHTGDFRYWPTYQVSAPMLHAPSGRPWGCSTSLCISAYTYVCVLAASGLRHYIYIGPLLLLLPTSGTASTSSQPTRRGIRNCAAHISGSMSTCEESQRSQGGCVSRWQRLPTGACTHHGSRQAVAPLCQEQQTVTSTSCWSLQGLCHTCPYFAAR